MEHEALLDDLDQEGIASPDLVQQRALRFDQRLDHPPREAIDPVPGDLPREDYQDVDVAVLGEVALGEPKRTTAEGSNRRLSLARNPSSSSQWGYLGNSLLNEAEANDRLRILDRPLGYRLVVELPGVALKLLIDLGELPSPLQKVDQGVAAHLEIYTAGRLSKPSPPPAGLGRRSTRSPYLLGYAEQPGVPLGLGQPVAITPAHRSSILS